MTVLFISDLHLCKEQPRVTQAFFRFAHGVAPQAEALYILGDFFEYWIGDDYADPFIVEVRDHLRQLVNTGTPVYFMHGNRDFLLGRTFAEVTGMKIIPDPSVVEIYGQRVLLMHGDSLCTQDAEYQSFRKQSRSKAWQQAILARPVKERLALAKQLRERSKTESAMKPEDIMDVTPSEVTRVMSEHKVRTLIHGHTHRPHIHDIVVDGHSARRIVLGAWHERMWVLRFGRGGVDLKDYPL